jgi:hypothetical protein
MPFQNECLFIEKLKMHGSPNLEINIAKFDYLVLIFFFIIRNLLHELIFVFNMVHDTVSIH